MSCAGSRNHQTPKVSSLGQYLLQQGPGERPTSQLQPKTPCCCSAELCGRQDLGSHYRLHSCLSNLWSMGHSPCRRGSCPADGCLDSSAVSQGTHGAPLCSGCQCRAKPSPASRAPLTTGAERTAWYACVWPLAQSMVHLGPHKPAVPCWPSSLGATLTSFTAACSCLSFSSSSYMMPASTLLLALTTCSASPHQYSYRGAASCMGRSAAGHISVWSSGILGQHACKHRTVRPTQAGQGLHTCPGMLLCLTSDGRRRGPA